MDESDRNPPPPPSVLPRPPQGAGDQHVARPHDWRMGETRRWTLPPDRELFDRLTALPPVSSVPAGGPLRPSAVLVGLGGDGRSSGAGVDVLLTRRSRHLRNHAGEISFPGGRIDIGESPVAAANREAFEEVALSADEIEVVGELRHHRTLVSASHIIPVVARVARSAALDANPAEVERILWLPLAALTAPGVYHSELWKRGAAEFELHFFEVGPPHDETVWGATASMLVNLLDLVADRPGGDVC